ncbi:E3 ubiquitin-protein ligase prt1 [Thalictrum thalictroides]|uniref:E3 ubiquitin-protein ligase prt1 n=1 Tax=Thalictrum thalictroides TaxID=46969 RepID=A0A7J6VHR5_THATH|nr:E3 ubiquitin-protein ligase prt1 [Thalictrum thalictroides]
MDKKESPDSISFLDPSNTRDLLSLLDCNDDDVEEFDEGFRCCVCLDLLYKPIVLACGHISCFWCVHGAMSWFSESHCPICRCPYNHFPAICELLHFVLLKMYPLAYKARERQVLEEEKKQGCFSPQLDDNLSSSPCTSSTMCFPVEDVVQGMINPLNIVERQSPEGGSHVGLESTRTLAAEGNNLLGSNIKNGTCELLSVEDVLCFACKQLLFKPAVLNCGHVYCLSCISSPAHEVVKCQLCQRLHPKGFLKVCLELDQLLEKIFPREYALRREAVQLQPIDSQQSNPSIGVGGEGKQCSQSSSPHTCGNISFLGARGVIVHYGVGCDSCGRIQKRVFLCKHSLMRLLWIKKRLISPSESYFKVPGVMFFDSLQTQPNDQN